MIESKDISETIKSLSDYPKIKAFMKQFESLEAIKEYNKEEQMRERLVV